MNELFIAYERFWGQFVNAFGSLPHAPPGSLIPAYVNGNPAMERMPNGTFQPARLPYIIYEAVQPAMFGSIVSTVSIWDRDLMPNGVPGRPNFYGRVSDIAKQVLDKIHPENGVLLPVGNGQFIQILRGNVPFQIVATGESDPTFVRGVINLNIYGLLT